MFDQRLPSRNHQVCALHTLVLMEALHLLAGLWPLAFSFCGTELALWRGYRLLKASVVKGDRQFDQNGKFMLPAEYRDTENATKARRHKREFFVRYSYHSHHSPAAVSPT